MKDKEIVIRQHNAITEARYEMSALEKNLLYLLISKLQENDEPGKEYHIHLDEIKQNIGYKTPENLSKATAKIISRVYTIEEPNGIRLKSSLMTLADYCNQKKVLTLKISQFIHPYLISLKKNYTEFGLNLALSLKSKYSKRIYEMLSQHKKDKLFKISLEELKLRLQLKKKYESWTTFEINVLKKPQQEINSKTDIYFTYKPIKNGKKYSSIIFTIRKNPEQLQLNL